MGVWVKQGCGAGWGPGSIGDTVISRAQEREDKWKFIAWLHRTDSGCVKYCFFIYFRVLPSNIILRNRKGCWCFHRVSLNFGHPVLFPRERSAETGGGLPDHGLLGTVGTAQTPLATPQHMSSIRLTRVTATCLMAPRLTAFKIKRRLAGTHTHKHTTVHTHTGTLFLIA